MSVRAVAIRSGPRPALESAPVRARRRAARRGPLSVALADDRRLIGVKLMLIGMIVLAVMALEVPW